MEFGTAYDGSPIAVIYWYTYDTLGNPIFLVGTGVPDDNRLEIDFDSPHGMIYGEFNPNDVNPEDGGTALLEFSDPDNATFSYTPSAFSASAWGHTPIESLTLLKIFGIPHSNVK